MYNIILQLHIIIDNIKDQKNQELNFVGWTQFELGSLLRERLILTRVVSILNPITIQLNELVDTNRSYLALVHKSTKNWQ